MRQWFALNTNLETSTTTTTFNPRPPNVTPAVNWHLALVQLRLFCFARFEDIPRADRLPKEIAITVPGMFAVAGAEKITFVGRNRQCVPTLDISFASKDGLTTCIVTNASGLTRFS